jgi:hypothetical protein
MLLYEKTLNKNSIVYLLGIRYGKIILFQTDYSLKIMNEISTVNKNTLNIF